MFSGKSTTLSPWPQAFMSLCREDPGDYTTEPGMQFYSGHFLIITKGEVASSFEKYHGFCLETQHIPNSVNTSLSSTLLRPEKITGNHSLQVLHEV